MRVGTSLGKYTIESYLGGGGAGEVYRAIQAGPEGFSRRVAIKMLHAKARVREASVQLFAREARMIAMLHHRNIVQVYEFAYEQGLHFLVMEFIEGVTLREMIDLTLPFWLKVWIGAEVCKGLQYAHSLCDEDGTPLQIVHRDIKPQNILLSRQADVKLTDFGLAKMSTVPSDQLTSVGVVKGTPAYMSPEQRDGLAAAPASDVYSLAAVLCETFTGMSPYRAGYGQGSPLPGFGPEFPPDLDRTLRRALSHEPGLRPTSLELGGALQEVFVRVVPASCVSRETEDLAPLVEQAWRNLAEKTRPELAPSTSPAAPPEDFQGFAMRETVDNNPDQQHDPDSRMALTEDVKATKKRQRADSDEGVTGTDALALDPTVERRDPGRVETRRSRRQGVMVAAAVVSALALFGVGYLCTTVQLEEEGPPGARTMSTMTVDASRAVSVALLPGPDGAMEEPAPSEGATDMGLEADVGLSPASRTRLSEPRRTRASRRAWPRARGERAGRTRRARRSSAASGFGFLSVNSSPWARVFVDNRRVGVTPLYRHRLPSGRHLVRLEGKDGRVAFRRVRIAAERHLNLGLLGLQKRP